MYEPLDIKNSDSNDNSNRTTSTLTTRFFQAVLGNSATCTDAHGTLLKRKWC